MENSTLDEQQKSSSSPVAATAEGEGTTTTMMAATTMDEHRSEEEEQQQLEDMSKPSDETMVATGGRKAKRIGLIGYGHLGQFLKMELCKSKEFCLKRIWNRTEEPNEDVLPLDELKAENLADIDLVIEVAHPDIIHAYAKLILRHCDLFIGSPTALANEKTHKEIQHSLQLYPNRAVYIPSGTLWGAKDIQKMADLGVLKALSITMIFHPSAMRFPESDEDSLPDVGVLREFCEDAKRSDVPKVLYNGPVKQLCSLAPNNVNIMAVAAISAHNLGFEHTRARLIVDPKLTNWQIVEYEAIGENDCRSVIRKENPVQPGVVTGRNTYLSFLSSVRETLYKTPGTNIC